MEPVVIVGSGPSGVHFALSALEKGYSVTMLDVGGNGPPLPNPNATLNGLKESLDDPVGFFLGENFESLILPGGDSEYYGFPPNKQFVFETPEGIKYDVDGFAPLTSFAAGGLAEAWTGGCYPFNDADLADYPFDYEHLAPHYATVANRIGISRTEDDLSQFFPWRGDSHDPLEIDDHARLLIESYQKNRRRLNSKYGCFMGRSIVAASTRPMPGRDACSNCGRCLWGCPTGAFYTPSLTLRECGKFDRFTYLSDFFVTHFTCDETRRITHVVGKSSSGVTRKVEVGTLVLAAGTLSTSKIVLDSLYRRTGEVRRLEGLMDNRQVLIPFVNLKMIGRRFNPETYQYNQVAIGLSTEQPEDYVHGLVTTLKTSLVHPIVQSIPGSLQAALRAFRNIHGALGMINVNFRDRRRSENAVFLRPGADGEESKLCIRYSPESGEAAKIKRINKRFRRILRRLGCIAPARMTHTRPMGASVHYAGTIPMSDIGGELTVDSTCRSNDFDNLFIVDGSTFPSVPAKNLTFTLMANAVRVAELAL